MHNASAIILSSQQ